jgi:hypothetical protein
LSRTGTTDEIAKVLAFLACDESGYIVGIELFVEDGEGQIGRSSPPLAGLKARQPSSWAVPHGTVWK